MTGLGGPPSTDGPVGSQTPSPGSGSENTGVIADGHALGVVAVAVVPGPYHVLPHLRQALQLRPTFLGCLAAVVGLLQT